MDQNFVDNQSTIAEHKTRLQQRLEIIKNYSKLINQSDYLKILHQINGVIASIGPKVQEECEAYEKDSQKFDCFSKFVIPNLEHRRYFAEMNSNFVSNIHLAKLYFGEETKSQIKALEEGGAYWWESEGEIHGNILTMMHKELYLRN